ncbi:hypothetical protein BH11PSE9_BH11PSE9_29980 [soil metagenome]
MLDEGRVLLWAGVVAIGAYHGLNPAMGWPLAVANGMTDKRGASLLATFVPLGAGHLLAIALVLVPFALLTWLVAWQREIRVVAGALVVLFGISRLLLRRHPRWLMRVRPTQLLLWSLLMATAHGAALMLLPIVMGLCQTTATATATAPLTEWGHAGAMTLMRANIGTAIAVSLLHSAAMVASGLLAAWSVYRYLGLRVLRSAWLNLDLVWALSLIASGAAGVVMALLST